MNLSLESGHFVGLRHPLQERRYGVSLLRVSNAQRQITSGCSSLAIALPRDTYKPIPIPPMTFR